MCVCVFICTYTRTYIRICIRTCTWICVCTCKCVWAMACGIHETSSCKWFVTLRTPPVMLGAFEHWIPAFWTHFYEASSIFSKIPTGTSGESDFGVPGCYQLLPSQSLPHRSPVRRYPAAAEAVLITSPIITNKQLGPGCFRTSLL